MTANVSNFDLLGWLKILLFAGVVFFAFKLSKKFNLLGDSAATQEAKALGNDVSLANTITNNVKNPNSDFNKAIHQKFGKKPTKAQMDSLLPNKAIMPKLMSQINDAHNMFSPNDYAKIEGAFKELASQYEVNFMATLYAVTNKTDMYGKLNQLMHDSDMADLRAIINSKPLI